MVTRRSWRRSSEKIPCQEQSDAPGRESFIRLSRVVILTASTPPAHRSGCQTVSARPPRVSSSTCRHLRPSGWTRDPLSGRRLRSSLCRPSRRARLRSVFSVRVRSRRRSRWHTGTHRNCRKSAECAPTPDRSRRRARYRRRNTGRSDHGRLCRPIRS